MTGPAGSSKLYLSPDAGKGAERPGLYADLAIQSQTRTAPNPAQDNLSAGPG